MHMKILTTISALFIIGGSAGWLIELIFRRMVHGKWINPGFLCGPCLPLYGTGVLVLYGFCNIDLSFIPQIWLRKVFLIIALTVVLTVIEYITGIVFVKFFHVKLWDYSSCRGNIQGVICPLFSLAWGATGAGYALFLHPCFAALTDWLAENPIYNFFSGMYVGVLLVDVCYSFHVVKKLKEFADEKQLVIRYENLKLSIARRAEELKLKRNFTFPFHTPANTSLREEVERYIDTLKEKGAFKPFSGKRK